MFNLSIDISILPIAWTASTCKIALFSLHILDISSNGWIIPVSLFTAITETKILYSDDFLRLLSKNSKSIIPSEVTGISFALIFCFKTESCSIEEINVCIAFEQFNARVLASVAPEVKIIFCGLLSIVSLIISLESSIAFLAALPEAWIDDGLPIIPIDSFIISTTWEIIGAEAL